WTGSTAEARGRTSSSTICDESASVAELGRRSSEGAVMNLMDYLSARFRRAKDGLREAPLVPGDPLTGHLLRFREDAIGTLEDVASRGGEVVRAPFGPFLTFVISDPEHVQTVLVDRHRDFPKFQIG